MQDMGVPGMQTQSPKPGKDEDGIRVLSSRRILSHYSHVKSGARYDPKRCVVCADGVDGAITVFKDPDAKPEPVVVPDNRGDKAGDSPSAPDSGWPYSQ